MDEESDAWAFCWEGRNAEQTQIFDQIGNHMTHKRIVEKSHLTHSKTVSTTTLKEHDRDGGLEQKKFLWESIQEDDMKQRSSGKKTEDRSSKSAVQGNKIG